MMMMLPLLFPRIDTTKPSNEDFPTRARSVSHNSNDE